jgi:serine phosphatase RsbU (regulator of sigma subunit)
MSKIKLTPVPAKRPGNPQTPTNQQPFSRAPRTPESLALAARKCLVPQRRVASRMGNFPHVSPVRLQDPSIQEHRSMLESLASRLSVPPRTLRTAKTIMEGGDTKKRRANQMTIAREVQQNLLPKHMPRLETLEYAGSCEPAWAVGGDYYDFLGKGDGRVGFVLADVSGKGVSAALLMASLQASVRSQYIVAAEDLADLFRAVNKLFYESVMAGFFATLFFAEYFDTTRKLRYVNCGHCPAFLLRADGQLEKLHSTATVLGMFEKWDCAVGETSISCGDTLIVYSDGVTESRSPSGEFFGEERLLSTIRANATLPAASLLRAISAAAHEFAGKDRDDDLTLLVGRGSEAFSRATA